MNDHTTQVIYKFPLITEPETDRDLLFFYLSAAVAAFIQVHAVSLYDYSLHQQMYLAHVLTTHCIRHQTIKKMSPCIVIN